MLNSFIISIVAYIIVMGGIIVLRPPLFFKEDGSIKPFGLGKHSHKTPIPLWLFGFLTAFLTYMFATLYTNAGTVATPIQAITQGVSSLPLVSAPAPAPVAPLPTPVSNGASIQIIPAANTSATVPVSYMNQSVLG